MGLSQSLRGSSFLNVQQWCFSAFFLIFSLGDILQKLPSWVQPAGFSGHGVSAMFCSFFWYPLVMTFTVCYWKWPSRNSEFFPIKNGGSFQFVMLNYQAGYHLDLSGGPSGPSGQGPMRVICRQNSASSKVTLILQPVAGGVPPIIWNS